EAGGKRLEVGTSAMQSAPKPPTSNLQAPVRTVAQLAEHRSPKPGVGGSIPSCPASLRSRGNETRASTRQACEVGIHPSLPRRSSGGGRRRKADVSGRGTQAIENATKNVEPRTTKLWPSP